MGHVETEVLQPLPARPAACPSCCLRRAAAGWGAVGCMVPVGQRGSGVRRRG